ncbi:MAG TPA: Kdo hydroxylase family protein [Thermoanaerobaculia bacterium]|nr:Kdo hydroxylase family protein [Thermoanaerobaculia bacterium]
MPLVTITPRSAPDEGSLARQLESGAILSFPDGSIALGTADLEVLRRQNPSHSRFHKNIAYRPDSGRLGGVGGIPRRDREPIRRALASFSREAVRVVGGVLPRYARSWRVGYTSFRPFEEAGRPLRTTSRNDLMHFDAFPSRPTNGDRILRFFVNVHPSQPREWISGGPFERLAERYAVSSGILAAAARSGDEDRVGLLSRIFGRRREKRSAYDEFMLRFHDYLKRNDDFQKNAPREEFSFAPGATWMVFTDGVSHAVLSGRHALEQTFLISRDSLASPESAPIGVLERLAGRPMTREASA